MIHSCSQSVKLYLNMIRNLRKPILMWVWLQRIEPNLSAHASSMSSGNLGTVSAG